MNASHQKLEAIFDAASELASPEREIYLARACGHDADLRQRVEKLLCALDRAGQFLSPSDQPDISSPVKVAGTSLPTANPLQDAPDVPTVTRGPLLEKPGALIGRYKLLEKLGEGGFGAVYVAEQREPVKRRVALKIIKLGMNTRQVVARFEAERQALALMDHPHIAKVLDAGSTDTGRPFFVMELVRGVPITRYCEENRLPSAARLKLFIQVCQAIQHAHQKGIIHRDIKPSNILVTLHDGVPVPKVIDFGIAKATQGDLTDATIYTQFAQFIGTPAYMSPEQAELSGLDIDTRSDIYSLGVLLYELLVGKTPFDAKELMQSGLEEMRRTIREKEPVRPSTRLSQELVAASRKSAANPPGENSGTLTKRRSSQTQELIHVLRGDLDWIVMKCLEKDRTRRYETANGLAADLQRHLNNEPVVARPPSASYRLRKLVRRNKLAFAAGAAVSVTLVFGILISSWQLIHARKAERVAKTEAIRSKQLEKQAREESDRAKQQEHRAEAASLEARENLYAADMLLAHHAYEDGNLDLALTLLNRHRPQADQPDLRGWEWRYLWGACRSDEISTFATNAGSVAHIAFSRDGSFLAGAGNGPAKSGVTIWRYPSGQAYAVPESTDAAGTVAFSPDGKLLAFGTRNHGLKLWDIARREVVATLPGQYGSDHASALIFSPDGRTLAAAGAKDEALLWNVESKTRTLESLAVPGGADAIAFSPDGTTLATGVRSDDSRIRLWSLSSGQELTSFNNNNHPVQFLTFSADGKILAAASMDTTFDIWDFSSRRLLKELTNHTGWVSSLAFSPDRKTLASSSADFTIKLWDTASWEEITALRGSMDEVNSIAFSWDGKILASASKDGRIKTWNPAMTNRGPDRMQIPADAESVWWRFGAATDGTLYCFHTNATMSLWDAATFRKIGRYPLPEGLRGDIKALYLVVMPGGKLAWANRKSEIVIWDLRAGQQLARFAWVQGDEKSLFASDDGKFLVGTAAGQCLTIWDMENLREVATFQKFSAWTFVVRFSRDYRFVAAGNHDGTVEVWDLSRRERVADWEAHHEDVTGLEFTPDGKQLFTASTDATAALWEIATRRKVKSLTRTLNAFWTLTLALDGERVAAGTADGNIKIWNAKTGQDVAQLKTGVEQVGHLQFLPPDGSTLLSVTSKEVRLWRAPSREEIAAAEARKDADFKKR